MTKPLNIDEKTGEVMSSNHVIWQGPDIPCLDLCKGTSITEVVYQLATKFCNLLDSLDVSNYDLTCLDLGNCPPETFQELIQVMIEAICIARDTAGPAGANGTNGNYVITTYQPPSDECEFGGVKIEVFSGTTNLVIDTKYVCNGQPGTNGLQGIPGPPGIGKKGDPGTNGVNGNPATIRFDQTDNCEIEITQNAGNPDYDFTIALQDSGWLPLRGFNHYGAALINALPPNNSIPSVRKIGKTLHFRGLVVIPLSNDGGTTLIPLNAYTDYNNAPYNSVYTGAGGVTLNSNGSLIFNKSTSVLPLGLNFCSKVIDAIYEKQVVSSRQIVTSGGTDGAALSAVFNVTISSTGQLVVQTLKDIEDGNIGTGSNVGGSPLRYITSKVKSGDYVPDFSSVSSNLHHNPVTGAQNIVGDFSSRTYLFDCDAAEPGQIGGFVFKLDGLTVFLT